MFNWAGRNAGPFILIIMKRDEIIDLLKIPDEIANKAYIHDLKSQIKNLNNTIDKLEYKIYRLRKDCENKANALHRRKIQINDLKSELDVVNQFIDPKYK